MALIVSLAIKILLLPYQLLILIKFYLLAFTKLILTFFYHTFLDARTCTYKSYRMKDKQENTINIQNIISHIFFLKRNAKINLSKTKSSGGRNLSAMFFQNRSCDLTIPPQKME